MQATNIFFTKLIKLDGRLREFNFRKASPSQNSFHVDVTDERGRRIMFRVTSEDSVSDWNVPTDSLPHWLQYAEPQICSAIKEEVSL